MGTLGGGLDALFKVGKWVVIAVAAVVVLFVAGYLAHC